MPKADQNLIDALDTVIEFLDGLMVITPSRELADACNLLQQKKEELES